MIGLLISVWLAFTSATVPQWNYVRDLQTYGEQRCESECLVDRRCVSWTYNDSNINNQGQGQCYLQSELFERLSSRIRPTSISTDSPQYKIGNSSSHQYTSRMRLLSGPVAIGRSTVINFPQSFYFGCSYTISAWFWLWKVTKMPLRHEMPIFSTHESTPALYSHQAILPSVVFNIGSRRDNIFFSTLKDSRGDYEGTWGGEVEYNKWIHLAITFSRDKMMVYMNGKLHCEPMVMSKKQQYLSHVCPEIEYPHHLNRTTALPNNTIMQLGGSKQGSMLGMLSNIDIFRGLALDEHHIKQWMLQNIPVQFPTLQKLVQTSAKYIFKTSIGYQDDYALVDYGICPVSKCGPICVPTEVIPPDEEVQNVDSRDEASWGGDALDGVESVSSEITPHGDIDISPQGDVSQDEKTDTSTSFTSDPPEEVATDRDTPSRLKTSDLLKKQEKEWKNMFQLPNEGNWDDMGDLLNLDDATLQEISDIYGIDSALLDPTMSDEEILRALSEAAGYDVGLDGLNWDKTTERLLDEYYASAYYDNGHTDDMSFATGNHKSDHTGSSTVDDDITVIEEDYYYGDEYYIEDAVDYDEIELPNLDSETPQQQTESSTATPSDTPIQPVKLTAAELKARLDVQLRDPYFRTYVRAPAVGRDAEEYDSGKDTSSRSAAFSSGKLYSEVASIVASVLSVLRGQLYALRDGVLQHIQTTLDFLGLNVSAYNSSVINATASYEKSKYDKDIDAVLQRMLEKSSLLRDRLTSESEQVMRDWISTLASQHVDGVDVLEALLEGSFMVVESEASDPRVERIIELYDQAMHWMSGRHIVHTYDQLNGDKVMTRVMTRVHENDTRNIGHGIESTSRSDAVHGKSSRRSYMSDINIYRERSFEPSQSTLMAAMWLSDELELEYSILAEGGYFSNQQAGMLGQGPRLALGSRHNDMSPTVRYQGDFREYVSDIVHGKMEVLALGGGASDADISNPKSTVESTVIESADNKVRTSDDKAEEFGTTYLDFVAAVARMDAFLDSDSLIDENLKDILINVSSDAHSVSLSPSRVYNATIADTSDSLLHRIETSECIVAASYYLPVMRYVLANYGDTTTGVAIPEDIRLADIPSLDQLIGGVSGATSVGGDGGYTAGARQTATSDAMETSIRTHYVAEAAAGNPQAQVWLGIRSFWGSHGLEPNATAARKYFEMAAAKNHSEALYCLGAMYDNGQGGLPRNRTKALELFRLSAEQKVPWPASLQALGNYHWNSGPSSQRNESLAKAYFEKAAEMGNANGYYSLGTMYRDDSVSVTMKNIPLAVHLYTLAATQGNIRALGNLAYALYDSDSWIGQYAREQDAISRKQLFENSSHSKLGQHQVASKEASDLDVEDSHDSRKAENLDDEEVDDELSRWGYNETLGFTVILPGVNQVIPIPTPIRSSCEAALPLLKHLAEHSYRPNDLSKEALDAYMSGDIWAALELYEEAAELGVQSAQENAAFLYELIAETICPNEEFDSTGVQQSIVGDAFNMISSNLAPAKSYVSFVLRIFGSTTDLASDANVNRNTSVYSGQQKLIHSPNCKRYFKGMATRRWIQVANNGDVEAMREVASMYESGIHVEKNLTQAASLYAHAAAMFGDISSVMALAWMIHKGHGSEIPKNLTLAALLYAKAGELETVYSDYGLSWATTLGVAPFLAKVAVGIEQYVNTWNVYKIASNFALYMDDEKSISDFLVLGGLIACFLILVYIKLRRNRRM